MEQQRQIDIKTITDLELAELLSTQIAQAFQVQQNVTALQSELERRKTLIEKPQVE